MSAILFKIDGPVDSEMRDRKGQQSRCDARFQMLRLDRHEQSLVVTSTRADGRVGFPAKCPPERTGDCDA